ncbi:hypothetical protein [Rhizobium leguminosarum]|uniref:hypothetical protein n=1 Tax=Rhizobium leguminosarum TaxID=384 RepID=UPI001FDEB414|nr:hypothetical protein [Rhizobium leguminosarum]
MAPLLAASRLTMMKTGSISRQSSRCDVALAAASIGRSSSLITFLSDCGWDGALGRSPRASTRFAGAMRSWRFPAARGQAARPFRRANGAVAL